MSIPPDASPTDLALLRRYHHERDMPAFATLLDRHQADLLRTAHALLGDAHAAQDAVQEAFMRLCREAGPVAAKADSRTGLGGWLCTVVRNHCIDQLRRRRYATLMAAAPDARCAEPLAPLAADDAGQALWRAVAGLPPLERAAVVLRYRDGLSYPDIALRLAKSATHVGVLLHQAMGRLRQSAILRQEALP